MFDLTTWLLNQAPAVVILLIIVWVLWREIKGLRVLLAVNQEIITALKIAAQKLQDTADAQSERIKRLESIQDARVLSAPESKPGAGGA